MQKYDVTYVYRLYKSKIRLYLLNVLVKDFFAHAHCPEIPSVKKTPKSRFFSYNSAFWGLFEIQEAKITEPVHV